jgi:hypothetical protein
MVWVGVYVCGLWREGASQAQDRQLVHLMKAGVMLLACQGCPVKQAQKTCLRNLQVKISMQKQVGKGQQSTQQYQLT